MNNKIVNSGKINIIIGCMYSGKSTEMIRIINRYKNMSNINILVINHKIDKRYGENVVSSHDKVQIKCLSLENLSDLKDMNEYNDANIIFIEEAQFFKDLYDFSINAADKDHKHLYVVGLDGDYLRRPFGDICKLIPHAEEVTKLKALCLKCNDGTEAAFTKRIVDDNSLELVGSNEKYIAVCRYHYLEKSE